MKRVTIDQKLRRRRRVSTQLAGSHERPRVSVFRSIKYIYGQAIDDKNKITLAAFSSLNIKDKNKMKKSDTARTVGLELGKILLKKKITQVVFDRNIYAYRGRVRQFCEGLREAGIKV
jgi:large subunit ribosomal protein L18